MKKLLVYAFLLVSVFYAQTIALIAQPVSKVKFRGVVSSDSENVGNEIDPRLTERLVHRKIQVGGKKSNNSPKITGVPNGLNIMKEITDKVIEREYKFTLLSNHKYMVNSCLGIKVSAGEFTLRFSNPHVEFTPMGQVKIRLEVDKITLNAFRLRMRPRSPDFSDPNPCHFSGKFSISGEAKNLSVTTLLDPVLSTYQAAGGGMTFCFLGWEDAAKVDWTINVLNFFSFVNTMDGALKNMVMDGLDLGMMNIVNDVFIDIAKSVMKKYYAGCEQVYQYAEDQVLSASVGGNSETGASDNAMSNTNPAKEESSEKWVITPVPTMKGVLGRLDINFPADIDRDILIYQPTDKKFLTSVSRNDKTYPMSPGVYRFTLSTVPVDNVPIQKGHETRLKSGFLNVVSDGDWHLYDSAKEKAHTSGNKPKKLALPIGSYQLKLGLNFYPFEIKDGETVEL
ncbi:MAG: hypothetical protein H7Y42_07830 [Chitinophagaceae bacterium]|nr:hypothetical protein [Chitinophagaceae bacterium]